MSRTNSLTPLFTKKDIIQSITVFGVKAESKMLRILIQAGEYAVAEARKKSQEESFIDHTGNLRSSIGYVIAKNGVIHTDNFEESAKGTDKVTGKRTGYQLAVSLADKYRMNGYVLIVVAGMEYAAVVQNIENKDVLLGTVIKTESYLGKLISKFKTKLYG